MHDWWTRSGMEATTPDLTRDMPGGVEMWEDMLQQLLKQDW